MPIVTRKARDIVRRAFDLLGLIGENEPMSGYQATTGLELLNDILDSFASGGYTIPVFTEFTFNMTAGVRKYKVLPDVSDVPQNDEVLGNRLIELVTVQVKQGDIQYPVRINDLNSVETHDTVTNSQARPEVVALTRWLDDGTTPVPYSALSFYPFPDVGYETFVRAKAYLNYVDLEDSFTGVPASTHLYISYELAYNLLNFYESANWTPMKDAKYKELKANFEQGGDFDLTIQNTGVLQRKGRFYTRRLTNG